MPYLCGSSALFSLPKDYTMRPDFFLLLACLLSLTLDAQSTPDCAATQDEYSRSQMTELRQRAREHTQTFQAGAEDGASIINVPVQVHIIRRSDGSDGMTVEEWEAALGNANDYYAEADLYFFDCNPPNFIDNDAYFDFEANPDQGNIMPFNQVADVMNVYVPGGELISFGGNSICGYAYFPYSSFDVIVTKYDCMVNGTTFVHEIGHFFGLYHTHGTTDCGELTDELVNGSNCANAGDEVCDTPADPNLRGLGCDVFLVSEDCNYLGDTLDANGEAFDPDVNNIMSYSRKECRTYLSPEQYARANFYAVTARDYLICSNGCTAPEAQFTYELIDGVVAFTNQTIAGNEYNWVLDIAPPYTGETPEPVAYPPGAYEVCLTAENECGANQHCQTVLVPENNEGLVFSLGEAECIEAGEPVNIPIVFENFGDVLNFQFSVTVEKPSVARLTGITFETDFIAGSAAAVINDSTGTLIWDSNEPASFLDGTVVAHLSLEVLPGANDSSLIMITDEPTDAYAEDGEGEAIAVSGNDGQLSRCRFAMMSGKISRADGAGVAGVDVFLFSGGEMIEQAMTDAAGNYDFQQLPTQADYLITPDRNDNYLNGVNAGDLSRIQQHLLSVSPMTGPYPIIAGDVSEPGSLNSGDLSRIRQLILGDITAFSDVDSWRFVRADHVFADEDEPTAENFPEAISVDSLEDDLLNVDFVAMKMGDVNNTASNESESEVTFLLNSEGLPVVGEAFSVDVRAVDFENMLAGQFSIGWDSSRLSFVSVTDFAPALNLAATNFSFAQTQNGRLPWVWFTVMPTTLTDSTVMFRMNFTISAAAGDSIGLCFTEQPTSFYFENEEEELSATFGKYASTALLDSGLRRLNNQDRYTVFPNPVSAGVFHLGQERVAPSLESLRIFDLHARLLLSWDEPAPGSYQLGNLPAGVYQLVIQDADGIQVERLVVE
ncbi:hypothetical protein CEQ90_17755 [Lewinellaceae bacterium SD302]|nr:hypothetical protein CEQ90_17755 [Lewinellaceae bacterium SD302]